MTQLSAAEIAALERQALTRKKLEHALELANEAVAHDEMNKATAVDLYTRSIVLLREVIGRVQGRASDNAEVDAGATQQELLSLQAIHDTYSERVNVLNTINNFYPPTPQSRL